LLHDQRKSPFAANTVEGSFHLDPGSSPQQEAATVGMRLFVSVRRGLDPLPATEAALGIELQPTWFFSPFTRQKWRRH